MVRHPTYKYMKLTADAEQRRAEWAEVPCTCLQSFPCDHCVSPDGPRAQERNDACWEMIVEADELPVQLQPIVGTPQAGGICGSYAINNGNYEGLARTLVQGYGEVRCTAELSSQFSEAHNVYVIAFELSSSARQIRGLLRDDHCSDQLLAEYHLNFSELRNCHVYGRVVMSYGTFRITVEQIRQGARVLGIGAFADLPTGEIRQRSTPLTPSILTQAQRV